MKNASFRTQSLVLVLILFAGCAPNEQDATSTGTASDDPKPFLTISAPAKAAQLWSGWGGKYVIFVHRDKPVTSFADFGGRPLMVAMIESDSIVGDVEQLCKDGGVEGFQLGIQNNPDVYGTQFLEKPDSIAIMVPKVADHYKFSDNPKVVEVRIK